jgi:hypothetical protein
MRGALPPLNKLADQCRGKCLLPCHKAERSGQLAVPHTEGNQRDVPPPLDVWAPMLAILGTTIHGAVCQFPCTCLYCNSFNLTQQPSALRSVNDSNLPTDRPTDQLPPHYTLRENGQFAQLPLRMEEVIHTRTVRDVSRQAAITSPAA